MIVMKPASELVKGDMFSTDGYVVVSAVPLRGDGRISIELWLDASGGIQKRATLAPDTPCPIYIEEPIGEPMKNYAVCLNTSEGLYDPLRAQRPDDWWIEFYWAEDTDHAEQQAEDANPNCAVVCVAVSPYAVLPKEPA